MKMIKLNAYFTFLKIRIYPFNRYLSKFLLDVKMTVLDVLMTALFFWTYKCQQTTAFCQ